MNRELIHAEFQKIRAAFKSVDVNFRNVDIHVGEHLRRLLKIEKTVDEMYLNAMTRDRMWTCLMGLLFEKGVFTKDEFDGNIEALNKALEEAAKEKVEKKKESDALAKTTVLSDQPEIPVITS